MRYYDPEWQARKLIREYYHNGGHQGRTIPKKRRRKTPAWIYTEDWKTTFNYGLIEDLCEDGEVVAELV